MLNNCRQIYVIFLYFHLGAKNINMCSSYFGSFSTNRIKATNTFPYRVQLDLPHAPDVAELVQGDRVSSPPCLQGIVGEDDISRRMLSLGDLLAKLSEGVQQGLVRGGGPDRPDRLGLEGGFPLASPDGGRVSSSGSR